MDCAAVDTSGTWRLDDTGRHRCYLRGVGGIAVDRQFNLTGPAGDGVGVDRLSFYSLSTHVTMEVQGSPRRSTKSVP